MSSIAEQIVTGIVNTLIGKTPAGDRVFRSRVLAMTHDEAPSLVVSLMGESDERHGSYIDVHTLRVRIDIYVRGDPFDQLADPVRVPAHRELMRSQSQLGLFDLIRKIETDWSGQEADDTAGFVSSIYEIQYSTSSSDISVQV